MLAYLVGRIALGILTIALITVISFFIINLPEGDYLNTYIAMLESFGEEQVTWDEAQTLREQFGLNKPVYVQFFKWVGRLIRGDFGVSLAYSQSVTELIGERLLLNIILAGSAIIFTWSLAIPIGIYSAMRKNSFGDYLFTFLGYAGLSIPDFLLALVLMYLSYLYLGSSIGGLFSPEYVLAPWSVARVVDMFSKLWIPAVVLGTSGTASLIRIMRANLLDEVHKPYVVTARSKGLGEIKAVVKYAVRVAINPLLSNVGYLLPNLVSGSVIVAIVLSLPTLGPVYLEALKQQDMFLAGGILLILGVLTVVGTLFSDMLLMIADPRIRMDR